MNPRLLILFLFPFQFLVAQNVCNESGNLIIYSNFEGGLISIIVDIDIPDLKIGINTYYTVDLKISGAYAKNVTGIHCINTGKKGTGSTIPKTKVAGVDNSIVKISTENYFGPCGGFEGGTACNDGYLDPAFDDLMDYFQTTAFPSSVIHSYKQQFGSFSDEQQLISEGGNCCMDDLKIIKAEAGKDKIICTGQKALLGVQDFNCSSIEQAWSPADGLDFTDRGVVNATPRKTTTYTLTLINDGTVSTDKVTVFVKEIPTMPIIYSNSPVCRGTRLQLAVKQNPNESYVWEGPDGLYSSESFIQIDATPKAAAGKYTLKVDLNGCGTVTATSQVVVKECDANEYVSVFRSEGNSRDFDVTKTGTLTSVNTNTTTTATKTTTGSSKPTATKLTTTSVANSVKQLGKSGTTSSKKYKFENSRKNGVFIVSGFDLPIDRYDNFVVQNQAGDPVKSKKLKYGQKLIIDISDRPLGKYKLIISRNDNEEVIDFILGAQ